MKIKETLAKTIITRSQLPDTDFVINPYTGCQFACSYCYASFMGRFVNESITNWENYLYVKKNAVECFNNEYKKLKPKNGLFPTLLLSSVTDPYQGAEKKYCLTRGILESLVKNNHPGRVSLLPKSPLILRDKDLIKSLPNIEVGLTITTTNDLISRNFEINAPSTSRRIKTLRLLSESRISTYAFIGPLLPHYLHNENELNVLIKNVAEVGVKSVYIEHINLNPMILKRLQPILNYYPLEIQKLYQRARFQSYRDALDNMIYPLIKQYGLTLKLNKTLYH